MLLTDAPSWRASLSAAHGRRAAVRRLALSRFVSAAGTDASGVAIGFALYAQTGSAAILSLSLFLTTGVGALVAPFAGRLGDRVDRRRLMLAAELSAAAVFAAMAIFQTAAALLALGLLATSIGAIFGPAAGAAVAHVAGEERMSWASGLIATGTNVGKTAGRLVAGALIAALGVSSVLLLDAITFLLSAWLIWTVRRAVSAPRPAVAADEARRPPQSRHDGGCAAGRRTGASRSCDATARCGCWSPPPASRPSRRPSR